MSNKGAPGVDGIAVDELGEWLWTHMAEMRRRLPDGSRQPQEVKGVSIPEPNGGRRQPGTPTVIDRQVWQAMAEAPTPVLDPRMSESSHGFRLKRSALQAVRTGSGYVREGYEVAVDLDLEKFFDRVNHDIPMSRLARRIRDKRTLFYVRRMLNAGMMVHEGVKRKRERGTPQGGPLSPPLANVPPDDFDKELERRGHRFRRYADDCVISVKTMEAGERAPASVTRYLENVPKMKVNQRKSEMDKAWNCVRTGYVIGGDGKLRIALAKVKEFKAKVRLVTRRNQPPPLREVIARLPSYMRGWANYFRLAAIRRLARELDEWIRRRLRCLRLKQCKHPRGIRRFLESIGAKRKLWSGVAAMGRSWWRNAHSQPAHICMDNEWLSSEGYVSLQSLLGP